MSSGAMPEGLVNFRDVATQSGIAGILRPGTLFRSESPQFLTAAGAADVVERLGVRVVLDLRFAAEVRIEGRGPLGDQGRLRYLGLPLLGTGGENIDVAVPAGDRGGMLAGHYISFLQDSGDVLVEIAREVAAADGSPVLIHCAAGKDRTGVAVALLLDVLGVDEEAIISDYARTRENMPAVLASLAATVSYGPSVASHVDDDERAQARPESMQGLLRWLRQNFGTAEQYLIHSGVEPATITRLRRQLSVQAAA